MNHKLGTKNVKCLEPTIRCMKITKCCFAVWYAKWSVASQHNNDCTHCGSIIFRISSNHYLKLNLLSAIRQRERIIGFSAFFVILFYSNHLLINVLSESQKIKIITYYIRWNEWILIAITNKWVTKPICFWFYLCTLYTYDLGCFFHSGNVWCIRCVFGFVFSLLISFQTNGHIQLFDDDGQKQYNYEMKRIWIIFSRELVNISNK